MTLAELSKLLFSPVTLLLYTTSMLAYLYAMAFTKVDRSADEAALAGNRARILGSALAVAGVAAHVAHILTRSIASGRWPRGNMFEFSSIMALTVVLGGLVILQWRMRRAEVMGFVLLGALITLGLSLLVYAEPAPLAPILDSWWRAIHVSAISLAAGIFTMGFVFNALHLLRDTAERRVAARTEAFGGSTVGAAFAGTPTDEDHDQLVDTVAERANPDPDALHDALHDDAYRLALRDALADRWLGVRFPWRIALGSIVVVTLFSLTFQRTSATLAMPLITLAIVGLAWWAVPYLPSASTLDSLAYRTIVFAFPIWTFAVITGAIWAEQSWGRYWGWDPKETSAFLTWVAYAGYLHARATRGMRGRGASWFGIVAFCVLMFTYFVVNLLITGLHSYAGL
ncbi:MAG: cytochrome c biogenesis protein CcsA [Actinomycetota bacterium]